MSNRICKNS